MQFSFTQVLLLWMLFIMAFGTTFLMLMDEVTACSNGGKNNYNQKRNIMVLIRLNTPSNTLTLHCLKSLRKFVSVIMRFN